MKIYTQDEDKSCFGGFKGAAQFEWTCPKYELHATQISRWKQEFLSQAEGIFEKKVKTKKKDDSLEKDATLKVIGELKMENDFLKNSLEWFRSVNDIAWLKELILN